MTKGGRMYKNAIRALARRLLKDRPEQAESFIRGEISFTEILEEYGSKDIEKCLFKDKEPSSEYLASVSVDLSEEIQQRLDRGRINPNTNKDNLIKELTKIKSREAPMVDKAYIKRRLSKKPLWDLQLEMKHYEKKYPLTNPKKYEYPYRDRLDKLIMRKSYLFDISTGTFWHVKKILKGGYIDAIGAGMSRATFRPDEIIVITKDQYTGKDTIPTDWLYMNPKKYDIRPTGRYIRERQPGMTPKKCLFGTYVTKKHPSGHAVVLCKTKDSFPKLKLQSILHPLSEKEKFKLNPKHECRMNPQIKKWAKKLFKI